MSLTTLGPHSVHCPPEKNYFADPCDRSEPVRRIGSYFLHLAYVLADRLDRGQITLLTAEQEDGPLQQATQ